jgi:ribosomal protein S18 acetylase RimI-like enzyme
MVPLELNNFTIRKAEPEDAPGIAKVHVKTWQCAYKGQIPNSYLDSLSIEKRSETWSESLKKKEEGKYPIVAVSENEIIGWCTSGKSRDDVSDEIGELYGIYVSPEYIGHGVGSALMKECLNNLKNDGYTKATLWVLATNEKTKQFYFKKGWVLEGKTKDDVRDGFTLHEERLIICIK